MLRIPVALVALMGMSLMMASSPAMAQVPDPVMAAQAPVPGSGHDYIGLATETVNPADGSLTFDLPLPVPPGRGLSLPFSIHYDSGLMYYLSPYSGLTSTYPNLNWTLAPQSSGPFMVPFLSFQAAIQTALYAGGTYVQCNWTTGFVFRGLDGVQYPLGQVGAHWSNTAYSPGDTPDTNCPYQPPAGGTYHGILVTPGTQDPTQVYGQPAMTLTDAAGTVYSFAALPVGQISSFVPFTEPEILLPQTITDRNGNQIKLTILGQNERGYIDTLGHTVVSWNFGPSGTSATVSGFGTVSMTSTPSTSPLTFPGTITSLGLTSEPCVKNSTQPNATTYTATSVINLPNDKTYTLSFDPSFGQINKIAFPDGGYVSYTWGTSHNGGNGNANYTFTFQNKVNFMSCAYDFDTPAITDRYVNDGKKETLHQHFEYSTVWNPFPTQAFNKSTTVTTTDEVSGLISTVVYTYGPVQADIYNNSSSWLNGSAPVERQIQYSDNNSGVLKTVNKTWGDVRHIIGEQTTFPGGQGSAKQYCYDANEQLIYVYEYGFSGEGAKPSSDPSCYTSAFNLGSGVQNDPGLNNSSIGPLRRYTYTALHSFGTTHIVDEPDSVTLYNGAGYSNTNSASNQLKQTSYIYDGGTLATSPVTTATGLVSPPGSRGNATSVTHWSNNGSSATTTYTYYETGQVATMTDPCGNTSCADMPGVASTQHKTTYVYTDSPSNASNTNAYLTSVTNPLSQSQSYQYNYTTGKLAQATDENGGITNYSYSDPLLRLTDVYGPNSSQNGARPHTNYAYVDGTGAYQTKTDPSGVVSSTYFDGMDHTTQAAISSDPGGADNVDTTYGGLGQVESVSNPYRTTGDPTYGITSYNYDGLGRKTAQCQPDNSSTPSMTCIPLNSYLTWSYSANSVLYTEYPTGIEWGQTTDGLGRMTQVQEPSATNRAPTLTTNYSYDLLDNLTAVNQLGTGSDVARNRSFAYDSLSRLTCASNPESATASCPATPSSTHIAGTVGYTYDANGNLASKTDNRGVVTTYTYDALNRLLSKSYASSSGGSVGTVSSCFRYDAATKGVGRLSSQWTQDGSCPTAVPSSGFFTLRSITGYDEVGRIINEQQCIPGHCTASSGPALGYVYDLAGKLLQTSNSVGTGPSALTITNTFDLAAHLASVSSSWGTFPTCLYVLGAANSGCTPASAGYGPVGPLTWSHGPNLTVTQGYTNRLWVNSISAMGQQSDPTLPPRVPSGPPSQ